MTLSARAYTRILRVARTLADLDGVDGVARRHVAEAISDRRRDEAAAAAPHFEARSRAVWIAGAAIPSAARVPEIMRR